MSLAPEATRVAGGEAPAGPVADRVRRLTASAARRHIEPDDDVAGALGDGQVLPDALLSISGLDLDLTAEQRRRLAREELASLLDAGIRFEAVLEAGFATQLASARDVADPRFTFILHEIGEETRHQRLFQRLITQIQPTARRPVPARIDAFGYRRVVGLVSAHPALFYALVLGGEEIPDLFQKIAAEHPDTDPFLREVNRYHRAEEARHLSFARAVYPEVWARATRVDRLLVRFLAPLMIGGMFDEMVHANVYRTVGLPSWPTWRAARRTPVRTQLRREATRPVLGVLLASGAIRAGRVPRGWRELCGVDAAGDPLADVAPLPGPSAAGAS